LKTQDLEPGVGKKGAEGQGQAGNARGNGAAKSDSKVGDNSRFGEFADVIYYKCGIPGHHKASYKKPRICFICKKYSHVVEMCPVKKKEHRCAKYVGSAANGLGFYNIEVTSVAEEPFIDFSNHGKVYVETRDIILEELQLELATCFNLNWLWQIRQIEEWCFLVRFPPNKKVEDMADFNSFNLGKERVSVSVKPWKGELEPFADMEEVWVLIKGIPLISVSGMCLIRWFLDLGC
jgi:hypothetical protein